MSLLQTAKYIWTHPIGRIDKLGALVRFLRWQAGARLVGAPVAVNFVNDTMLLVRPGMTGATGNIYVGLQEFIDMSFLLHFLRPGDLFADLGANIGAYTILSSGAVGANSIAFEPVPDTYGALQKNIRLNNLSHLVEARQEAIGDSTERIAFTTGFDTVNHIAVDEDKAAGSATVEVPLQRLDASLEGRCPIMLKVDVEGYELPALRGAALTLENKNLKCILIEFLGTNRYGHAGRDVQELIEKAGFRACRYDPIGRSLSAVAASERGSTDNTLYVRESDFDVVRERVSSAKKFNVLGRAI